MSHLSFHAGTSGKATKNSVNGMTRHTQRKAKGDNKSHSNEDIDRDKTKYNIDLLSNGKTMDERVKERLENEFTGKRKIRKDQVVMREIITQPSADMFEGLSMEQKESKMREFIDDAVPWFMEEFGTENVVGASVHLDETNPHMHVGIMPMTDDGKVRQTAFFKSPGDMKRMHREYRDHMNERGWGFETENKYGAVEGFETEEFKEKAPDIERQRREVAQLDATDKEIEERKESQKQELDELDDVDIKIKAKKASQEQQISELMEDDEIYEEAIERFTDENGHHIKAHLDRREEEIEKAREDAKGKLELADYKFNVAYQMADLAKDEKDRQYPRVPVNKELNAVLTDATNGKFGVGVKDGKATLGKKKDNGKMSVVSEDEMIRSLSEFKNDSGMQIEGTKGVAYVLGYYRSDEPKKPQKAHTDGLKTIAETHEQMLSEKQRQEAERQRQIEEQRKAEQRRYNRDVKRIQRAGMIDDRSQITDDFVGHFRTAESENEKTLAGGEPDDFDLFLRANIKQRQEQQEQPQQQASEQKENDGPEL